ncbi:hypothetical protein ACVW1B_001121 [Bradyrhizobium sp. USDA 4502]
MKRRRASRHDLAAPREHDLRACAPRFSSSRFDCSSRGAHARAMRRYSVARPIVARASGDLITPAFPQLNRRRQNQVHEPVFFVAATKWPAWTFSGFNQGDLDEYQACRYWTRRAWKRSVDVRRGIRDAQRASASRSHRGRNVQCRQGAPGLRSLGPLLLATGRIRLLRTAPSRMASSSAIPPSPASLRAPPSSRRTSWWPSRRTPSLIISEGASAPSPFRARALPIPPSRHRSCRCCRRTQTA